MSYKRCLGKFDITVNAFKYNLTIIKEILNEMFILEVEYNEQSEAFCYTAISPTYFRELKENEPVPKYHFIITSDRQIVVNEEKIKEEDCIGKFYISEDDKARKLAILKKMGIRIIRSIHKFRSNDTLCIAISSKYFRKLKESEPIPEYKIIFQNEYVRVLRVVEDINE